MILIITYREYGKIKFNKQLILQNVKSVELKIINKIFISNNIAVQPKFQAMTAANFWSESKQLEFSNSAGAASTINNWSANQTNNKIKNIIAPGWWFSFLKSPPFVIKRIPTPLEMSKFRDIQ